ncbi:MAG: hypothetical protein GF418_06195 [Chitinivibrionales bacterium]|nr:hypothetical protein [Chitinivibrionales bacterium]MBD3395202.1 hypothetical protein [Chitinivibrionales bacterium]
MRGLVRALGIVIALAGNSTAYNPQIDHSYSLAAASATAERSARLYAVGAAMAWTGAIASLVMMGTSDEYLTAEKYAPWFAVSAAGASLQHVGIIRIAKQSRNLERVARSGARTGPSETGRILAFYISGMIPSMGAAALVTVGAVLNEDPLVAMGLGSLAVREILWANAAGGGTRHIRNVVRTMVDPRSISVIPRISPDGSVRAALAYGFNAEF